MKRYIKYLVLFIILLLIQYFQSQHESVQSGRANASWSILIDIVIIIAAIYVEWLIYRKKKK